jgi:hypothetical protein
MNSLIYIPTGFNSPEVELLFSKAQEELDNKKKLIILTCSGKGAYACSLNVYSLKSICHACNFLKKKGLEKLKGNYEVIETPFLKEEDKYIFNEKFSLMNLSYKNFDIGLGVFSSYVNYTRDANLEGFFSKKAITRLYNTSVIIYDFAKVIFKKKNIKSLITYNSRMNQTRPIFRLGQQQDLKQSNLEFWSASSQVIDSKNNFITNPNFLKPAIEIFWKKFKKKKLYLKRIKKHFSDRLNSKVSLDIKPYTKHQTKKLLPHNWDSKKKNIVYFASSDDEHDSFGKENWMKLYKSQEEAIIKIAEYIGTKKSNYDFWIRMHPSLIGVKWQWVQKIIEVGKKFSNVHVINAESKVSTYEVLFNCDASLSTASTIIVEAVYYQKPVIVFCESIFSKLGLTYFPKSRKQLFHFIEKKLKPKKKILSYKWPAFYLFGGFKIKHMGGDIIKGFSFKRQKIRLNYLYKIIYIFGKIYSIHIMNKINFYLRS